MNVSYAPRVISDAPNVCIIVAIAMLGFLVIQKLTLAMGINMTTRVVSD